jgi:hypothetical protein
MLSVVMPSVIMLNVRRHGGPIDNYNNNSFCLLKRGKCNKTFNCSKLACLITVCHFHPSLTFPGGPLQITRAFS